MRKAPELLMPAGNIEKLDFAFTYGADAVYAGVPLFSLRARENEFDLEELKRGIQKAHALSKKFYLTANIFARNLKLKSFVDQVKNWIPLKPDAFIMSDPGLMLLVREICPEIPIHLSVQANCMNWQTVKFWHQQGVERVILSRELRIDEVREMKQRVPEMELEAFVHGSICIAYSGRCLLSHYMSWRDANQGVCDNSCRYPFKLWHKPDPGHPNSSTVGDIGCCGVDKGSKSSGDMLEVEARNDEFFLEDMRDPGQLYEIDEDSHGTYIMNSKDLRLIEHLKTIWEAGVDSFKVEGRTKSVYYVAMVARAYRQAIDDFYQGRPINPQWVRDLDKLAHRGYHTGFMVSETGAESQNYEASSGRQSTHQFVGWVIGPGLHSDRIKINVRNKIKVGQSVEFMSPSQEGSPSSGLAQISGIFSERGSPLAAAHGGTGVFEIELNGLAARNVPALSMILRSH